MNAYPSAPAALTARPHGLIRVGTALLVLLPLVVWMGNRAAPLVLTVAALTLLASSAVAGILRQDLDKLRQLALSRTGLPVLAFLAFALLSIAWSHQPLRSLRVFGELSIPLAAGFVVAALWPRQAGPRGFRMLAAALILSCVLVMIELRTNMALRIALKLKPQNYIFNPVMITYLLLAFPVLDGLWRETARWARPLAVLLAAVLTAVILSAESGAAVFGLLVGVLAWFFACFLPRFTLGALAIGFVASLALAPYMGKILDRALPPAAHEGLKNAHSRDRVDIWLSFGEAVRARPLTGAGFGTSAVYDSHPVAAEVSPARRTLLGVGHPHSLPLQIWAEMGVIGAIFALLTGLGALAALAHIEPDRRAAPVAMAATALAIATVGHGAWQAWWIAGIAASLCWFLRGQDERTGGLI